MQATDVELVGSKGVIARIEGQDAVALRDCLPEPEDPSYPYLGYIDPYDRTVFNSFQAIALVRELEHFIAVSHPHPVLETLLEMARQCQAEISRRLIFEGD